MEILEIFIMMIIGGLIGWLTNIVAIKLLFKPLYPIEIPIIKFNIQGLIPKRKNEIAKSIGEVVEEELLSIHEIIDKAVDEDEIGRIKITILNKINIIIEEKLPSLIPSTIKKMILNYVNDFIVQEGDKAIKELVDEMIDNAVEKVKISEIVEDKINTYDIKKIEEIIISVAKKELKHIEILGGILGLLIGLIQGLLVFYVF
ncbi:DUF445 family protein [Clostridium sp. D2Q-14]|uniref:DUF445 domain-containing protein n=1 Tax=Anaeromonas gelatinilytica TaxID=2683194 RepID=UPI00193C1BE2|nr:DUF445 family protein [Anaeromonas gelatinilytica]MBS4536284.1 DUF445 family protein [Anaeromonas gelatinilytica]